MQWALTVVQPPTVEPVTLDEAKAHLRVTDSAQDSYIQALIRAAREWCEEFQGRAYLQQELVLHLERWPSGRSIRLPRPPLAEVVSVEYTRADRTIATLDPAIYLVQAELEPGGLVLVPEASWPSDALMPGLPIRVTYRAGAEQPDQVSQRARQAMLLLIGHWYESREAVVIGATSRALEFSVEALLYPDLVWYPGPEG